MSRAQFLIHLMSLLLLGEVLGEPFSGSGHIPTRSLYMGRPPWVLVNPWDYWAYRSARVGAERILDPQFAFHVHVLIAIGLNRVFSRYEYYDVIFIVDYLPELVTDKFICIARIHWELSGAAHLEPGFSSRCEHY